KKRKGLLFLGTETGIYASFDDGGHWQSLRLDLPVTPVHGIEIRDDDLVIGTHGRSFYVMDNISVLRQIGRETTNEAVVLFDPAHAMRSVSRGVSVDYYLKTAPDKVAIEFLDGGGKVITTFTGTPPKEGEKPAAPAETDDGVPRPVGPKPPMKAGMNRFTW